MITSFNPSRDQIQPAKDMNITIEANDDGIQLLDLRNNVNTLIRGVSLDDFLADANLIVEN